MPSSNAEPRRPRNAPEQTTEVLGATTGLEAQDASVQTSVLQGARSLSEEKAAAAAQGAAEHLRRFAQQGVALADGRPQDAPDLADYVRHMADKLLEAADLADALAEDVPSRGTEGFLEDLQGLARHRPGLFVLSTAAALVATVGTPPARPPTEGDTREEDGPARDELEPAALDALLRALWPGDVDERLRAATLQRLAGSDQQLKKTAAPAGRRAKDRGQGTQSAKDQAPKGPTQVKDQKAEVSRRRGAETKPPSGAGKNPKQAKASSRRSTINSDPPRLAETRKVLPEKGAATASPGRVRRRAPTQRREG